MIIKLAQPSLALHSCDVPGYKYKMQTTWQMPAGATMSNVVFWIEQARKNAVGYLNNVVINCHGNAGSLAVGGNGKNFGIESAPLFEKLKKEDGRSGIGRIWFIACSVTDGADGLGANFCLAIAKAAGCKVIAANVTQDVGEYLKSFIPTDVLTILKARLLNLRRSAFIHGRISSELLSS